MRLRALQAATAASHGPADLAGTQRKCSNKNERDGLLNFRTIMSRTTRFKLVALFGCITLMPSIGAWAARTNRTSTGKIPPSTRSAAKPLEVLHQRLHRRVIFLVT
jgi:hypothetical protein